MMTPTMSKASALRIWLNDLAGHSLPWDDMLLLAKTLRGLARLHPHQVKQNAPPITKDQLIAILPLAAESIIGIRDLAGILLGTFGLLRRSELLALLRDHLCKSLADTVDSC